MRDNRRADDPRASVPADDERGWPREHPHVRSIREASLPKHWRVLTPWWLRVLRVGVCPVCAAVVPRGGWDAHTDVHAGLAQYTWDATASLHQLVDGIRERDRQAARAARRAARS